MIFHFRLLIGYLGDCMRFWNRNDNTNWIQSSSKKGLHKNHIFGFTLLASISLSISLAIAISAVPHVGEASKQLQIMHLAALPSFSLSLSLPFSTHLSLSGEILCWTPAALPWTKSRYFEVVVRCPWPLLLAHHWLHSFTLQKGCNSKLPGMLFPTVVFADELWFEGGFGGKPHFNVSHPTTYVHLLQAHHLPLNLRFWKLKILFKAGSLLSSV